MPRIAFSSKAVVAAFVLTAATGTAAAASTGVLPGAGDDDQVTTVRQDDPVDDVKGDDSTAAADVSTHAQPDAADEAGPGRSEHGSAVSDLATTTDLTGREKGAAVAALASGGRSHAGEEQGQGSEQAGKPDQSEGSAAPDEHSDESHDAASGVATTGEDGGRPDNAGSGGNPNA
ncbi:MAG: hypothetical protein WAN48_11135 [Actinomycetes bacterium]